MDLTQARDRALSHPDAATLEPWKVSTFALEGPDAYAFLGGPQGWAEGLNLALRPMDPIVFIVPKDGGAVTTHAGLEAIRHTQGMTRAGKWPEALDAGFPFVGGA